jgi:hypothetical protein
MNDGFDDAYLTPIVLRAIRNRIEALGWRGQRPVRGGVLDERSAGYPDERFQPLLGAT